MSSSMTVEATRTAVTEAPLSREVILGVLDEAPDGYKLLAQLVDDPCELLRDYDPGEGQGPSASREVGRAKTQIGKLEDQLRTWLVAAVQRESWQALGSAPDR